MDTSDVRLAGFLAHTIMRHEELNDHGGTYHQAIREFKECVSEWNMHDQNWDMGLPDGGTTRVLSTAVDAWDAEHHHHYLLNQHADSNL